MTRHKGQRAPGGGRSNYRHPVETARQASIRRTPDPRRIQQQRHEERVAAKIAQRERERAEGKIP